MTCHIKGCKRDIESGDKHLENGTWSTGYFKEGYRYCSIQHFKKGSRLDGWFSFLIGIFGVAALISGAMIFFSILWPILHIFWPHKFVLSGYGWDLVIAIAVCPACILAISQLEDLRKKHSD